MEAQALGKPLPRYTFNQVNELTFSCHVSYDGVTQDGTTALSKKGAKQRAAEDWLIMRSLRSDIESGSDE